MFRKTTICCRMILVVVFTIVTAILLASCSEQDGVDSATIAKVSFIPVGLSGDESIEIRQEGGDVFTIVGGKTKDLYFPIEADGLIQFEQQAAPPGKECSLSTRAIRAQTDLEETVVTVRCISSVVSADAEGLSSRIGGGYSSLREELKRPKSSMNSARSFPLEGSVVGLYDGESVTVQINDGEQLSIFSNGRFRFSEYVEPGAHISVKVFKQPTSTICSVENSIQVIRDDLPALVVVRCSVNAYVFGGRVKGLLSGGTLSVGLSDGQRMDIGANGYFGFPIKVSHGTVVSSAILTQPSNQFCTIDSGAGPVPVTSYTYDLNISCGMYLPKRVAFYYYNSVKYMNGSAGGLDEAINSFSKYDMVVLDYSYQFPQGVLNEDKCTYGYSREHAEMNDVIAKSKERNPKVKFFGYVYTYGLQRDCFPTVGEIVSIIDAWKKMGVDGIFLDEVWVESATSKRKINKIINAVHSAGLKLFVNPSSGSLESMQDYMGAMEVGPVPGNQIYVDRIVGKYGRLFFSTRTPHSFTEGDRVRFTSIKTGDSIEYLVDGVNGQRTFSTKTGVLPGVGIDATQGVHVNVYISAYGEELKLLAGDIILLEAHVVSGGQPEDPRRSVLRRNLAASWKARYGVEIAALATTSTKFNCLGESCSSKQRCSDDFNVSAFKFAFDTSSSRKYDYFGWWDPWWTCYQRLVFRQ